MYWIVEPIFAYLLASKRKFTTLRQFSSLRMQTSPNQGSVELNDSYDFGSKKLEGRITTH
jgi:hypothetical protein